MNNEYGLDYKYFENKLSLIVRDASRYTPGEMFRELSKYAEVARCSMKEPQPSVEQQAARIKELERKLESVVELANYRSESITKLQSTISAQQNICNNLRKQIQSEAIENEALNAENEAYKNAAPKDYILQSIAQKQYRQINDARLAMEEKNKALKAENERLKEALKFVSMSAASLESAQDMAYDALQLSEGEQ